MDHTTHSSLRYETPHLHDGLDPGALGPPSSSSRQSSGAGRCVTRYLTRDAVVVWFSTDTKEQKGRKELRKKIKIRCEAGLYCNA